MKINIRKKTITFTIATVCLLGSFFLSIQTKIIKNMSDSHPNRYFFVLLNKKPKSGDFVMVYSSFIGGFVIKKVLAKGPCSLVHLFPCQKNTIHGKNLTPNMERFIPKDFYFLYAHHPRSFDSRYKEMGLIHKRDILGVAYPIPFFTHKSCS